jgi:hypothetical protein
LMAGNSVRLVLLALIAWLFVGVVSGYGFLVWMSRLMLGPPEYFGRMVRHENRGIFAPRRVRRQLLARDDRRIW